MSRKRHPGTIYLLHFTKPLCHARHYLGWVHGGVTNVPARIERHRSGHGSPLVRAVMEAGGDVLLADTWTGNRTEERRLKRYSHVRRLCPVCRREDEKNGINPGKRKRPCRNKHAS